MSQFRRLRERWRESQQLQHVELGWNDFPPVSGSEDDVRDYLGSCRLRSVVIDAPERMVTVVVRDASDSSWEFSFRAAELFCDVSRQTANTVEGDLGIWDLDSSPPFEREGRTVRLFTLESNVVLSIYATDLRATRQSQPGLELS